MEEAYGRSLQRQADRHTDGRTTKAGWVYWGLTPQKQPGSYRGGEMMMVKSVFWWRKPEYPEEATDLRQGTGETFHTYGLCPVRRLNLGRSGVKQSDLRRDESGALANDDQGTPYTGALYNLCTPTYNVYNRYVGILTSNRLLCTCSVYKCDCQFRITSHGLGYVMISMMSERFYQVPSHGLGSKIKYPEMIPENSPGGTTGLAMGPNSPCHYRW